MLDTLRRGRRWGTAFIVLSLAFVFAAYLGYGGGSTQCAPKGAIVQVDGRSFGRDDFLRAYAQQEEALREMAGPAFDSRSAQEYLRSATAYQLVTRAVLASEAERLGIGISKEELRGILRADPGFQDESGRFDRARYQAWVAHEYGTEAHFVEMMQLQLLSVKLARLVSGGAHVSEAEARDAARYRLEEARIVFVALDTAAGDAAAALPEEEVAAFAAAHPDRIAQRYEEGRSQYQQEEAVRARHVLVRVAADAPEDQVEAARKRAEDVLRRIREGADFADVALEVSEDPGSQARGGDLGFFTRGQMTPAFEQAAFALEPGATSELVRSDFGFHVIRVEERRAGGTRSLDEARDELARELLAAERAVQGAREQADALQAAIASGSSLEEAARARGLTIERSDWLRRRPDGFVPGLGGSLAVQDAAFALPAGASAPRVFEVEGKLVLVQSLERREPAAPALAEAARQDRERLLEEERGRVLEDWLDRERQRLEREGRIAVNLALLDG